MSVIITALENLYRSARRANTPSQLDNESLSSELDDPNAMCHEIIEFLSHHPSQNNNRLRINVY